MTIRLYNTMTRKLEEFKPLAPGKVGFYSCGPTVYHYAHIGNLRTMIHNDIMKRMFTENGYDVHHVMNITDVGHLTNDEDDSGEDKMEKGAARENKSVWDVAKFFLDEFLHDFNDLNLLPPTEMPRATNYIQEQIELVQKLETLGYTYEIPNDGIYYDTSKFANYGALTGGSLSGNRAGARVSFNDSKRNPTDFALWKFSPTDAKRQMEWDSPWGVGFPGWHAECSAMSMKLLGNHFDIHTGGMDHIPVHHENEIAQAKGYSGHIPANYWMHIDFLQVNGGKMSKSLNNLYTLEDLKEKGYLPEVYRMFNFSSHYKKPINFTFEAMDAAKVALNRLREGYKKHLTGSDEIEENIIKEFEERFLEAINDDLNMPQALSIIWDVVKFDKKSPSFAKLLLKFDNVLGLNIDKEEKIELPEEILQIVEDRKMARINKDWKKSDELRDKLVSLGYTVKDTKDGMIVE